MIASPSTAFSQVFLKGIFIQVQPLPTVNSLTDGWECRRAVADLWQGPELNQNQSLSPGGAPAGFSDVISASAGLGAPLCRQGTAPLHQLELKPTQLTPRGWERLVVICSGSWCITNGDSLGLSHFL